MKEYTSFRVGGPAEVFVEPESKEELIRFFLFARQEGIPLFILGGGTNILVSDRGIPGVVLSLARINSITIEDNEVIAGAGTLISGVSEAAGKAGLSGLEFIYSMPGTLGGAVFMNARCYGREMADVLHYVEWMDRDGKIHRTSPGTGEYGYKISPFQTGDRLILGSSFVLAGGEVSVIQKEMEAHKRDRESKGHFLFPCAGSVFKNNRNFGRPSGAIIDSLGLRGFSRGDARISEKHANIIVNTGESSAEDIAWLIRYTRDEVKRAYGYELENEVIFVGEWEV